MKSGVTNLTQQYIKIIRILMITGCSCKYFQLLNRPKSTIALPLRNYNHRLMYIADVLQSSAIYINHEHKSKANMVMFV